MIDRLAAIARSPLGFAVVAAWACAEALLLPIVPDVVLLPLVAAAPRATPRLALALAVGALAGSAILAALTLAEPERIRSLLLGLPGIWLSTFQAVETDLTTRGAIAFAAVGPGVALKVYTTVWTSTGSSLLVLAGAVVLNRLTRIGPGIVIAALVGRLIPHALRHHERIFMTAYAVGWIALYLVYWRVV